jgi:hypothetical protein
VDALSATISACGLTVKAAQRVDRRKGLVVTLRAARACTVTLGASVKGSAGKRSAATKALGALKTKRQTLTLTGGKTRTLTLRFSKRALGFIKRALSAHRPMTLTLAVIEQDGSKRVSKRTVRTKLRA